MKNLKKELYNRSQKSGIFANNEILGSYHDVSQIIYLDGFDTQDYNQISKILRSQQKNATKFSDGNVFKQISSFHSTMCHELTHWLDHTSTLWGQKQLISIYNAINAWTNQEASEFYRISSSYSSRQRARLSNYYTESYANAVPSRPWDYSYSLSFEFGSDGHVRQDRPMIFSLFIDANNNKIIRIPISMVALTEANATYAEIAVAGYFLNLLDDELKAVEQNLWMNRIINNLYNQDLAIYSVATHCLANSIKLEEIFTAYKLSSCLSTLCLNIPSELYASIKIPDVVSSVKEKINGFKEIKDPGFIFFLLAHHIPDYTPKLNVEELLEETLSNAGLPSLSDISNLAYSEMKSIEEQAISGKYLNQLKQILLVGRDNFESRGIYGKNIVNLENLSKQIFTLPPILLNDDSIIDSLGKRFLDKDFIHPWMLEILEIESSMETFISACIA